MSRMKFHSLSRGALIAALLVALPLSSPWAAHRSEAEQAIDDAKATHEQAVAAKVATSETAEMIERAEAMMPSRQYSKAIELANTAKRQDAFALQQATSGTDKEADAAARQKADTAIAEAEAARKKAASVGGEWRDTAKMIAQAESLAKSGGYEEAIALANQAKHQGENGYAQAIAEQGAGFPSYMFKQP